MAGRAHQRAHDACAEEPLSHLALFHSRRSNRKSPDFAGIGGGRRPHPDQFTRGNGCHCRSWRLCPIQAVGCAESGSPSRTKTRSGAAPCSLFGFRHSEPSYQSFAGHDETASWAPSTSIRGRALSIPRWESSSAAGRWRSRSAGSSRRRSCPRPAIAYNATSKDSSGPTRMTARLVYTGKSRCTVAQVDSGGAHRLAADRITALMLQLCAAKDLRSCAGLFWKRASKAS